MSVQDDAIAKGYDSTLMRRLLQYLRPYWLWVIVAFIAIVGGSLADLAQPWLTAKAIDDHIAVNDLEGLWRLGRWFLLILITSFVFEYIQTSVMQMVGQKILHTVRRDVFTHLQRLDVKFYDRNPVGRLMTRVTTDVDALNDMFSSGVVTVFGDLIMLFGIMAIMVAMDWRLALVAFSVLPFIAWATAWFRRNVRENYRQVRGLVAKLNAFLQEHLTGMGTVQLFSQQARSYRQFEAINREHRDVNIQSIFYYALFYPIIEVLAALSGALIILAGGWWALEDQVSIGVLVAFLQYSRRFFQPISDLSEKFNILQAAMAASERIFGLLDTPVEMPTSAASSDRRVDGPGRIEFDRVWFAYKDDEFVLRDVSFVAEPGQRIGIVGATGSGKTTIISLLLRFYDVTQGRILVDGIDVREWPLEQLRMRFGLVLQDVHLFSGTISSNIRLGREDITDEAVREAAKAVHADRFVDRLPQGYDTPVAERGATLSVGQKQLLSFARALAFDPAVLVLDEATSSIDTETEGLIQDALHTLMAGRTVFAIAHRLSTIQDMDRILVVHKGQIRESGTHQELLALGGIYFKLWEVRPLIAPTSSDPSPAAAP
ncbi:MAG: ABC transporter ATP-binding protein [Acidimicrobiia bacterium]|nr:ABC transporter ATP-binding protein [Acidimicrobiia bacterium]